jgi:low affinity Fe/Cu permease
MQYFLENLARIATLWAGSTLATIFAFTTIIVWTIGGLFFFGFGTDYQMYVNTSTTIVSYLMVFLIQRTQNKEQIALHLKLNELLAAHDGASNRLLHIENLSEAEIEKLRKRYHSLAAKALSDGSRTAQHTVEEIDDN